MKPTNNDYVFTIVHRLEVTLREFIEKVLLERFGTDWHRQVPQGVLENWRRQAEDDDDSASNGSANLLDEAYFINLWEIISSNWSSIFSKKLKMDKASLQKLMQDVNTIRNRAYHAGVVSQSDVRKVAFAAEQMAEALDSVGKPLAEFLDMFWRNPEANANPLPSLPYGVESKHTPSFFIDVPKGEFSELIGRMREIRDLEKLLVRERWPVVTICGRGGVGKTALAVQLLHNLRNRTDRPFKAVVWVTAKETKLTPSGIERIAVQLRDYDDLLAKLVGELGGKDLLDQTTELLEEDAKLLLSISDTPVLLVVDNLETVSDKRIETFIKDVPSPSKVLVTSRRGLGEVEKRYLVSELSKEDSVILARQVALEGNENTRAIVKLDNPKLSQWLEPSKGVAAAIKWMVGQIALGKPMEAVRAEAGTGDPIQFFFQDVFNMLSEQAQILLCVLPVFQDPPTRENWLFVSGLSDIDVDKALEELTLASMVYQESAQEPDKSVSSRYRLAGLTPKYAQLELDKRPDLAIKAQQRYQDLLGQLQKVTSATIAYRYSSEHIGATTEREKMAAVFAKSGYDMWQDLHDLDAARGYFKKAVECAPTLAFVYRRWASVEDDADQYSEADKVMGEAPRRIPGDAGLWFHWAMLLKYSRRGRTVRLTGLDERIRDCLKNARKVDPKDHRIAHSLALAECKLRNFKTAEELLNQAEAADVVSVEAERHQLLCEQGKAELYKEWGFDLTQRRELPQAREKFSLASDYVQRALERRPADYELQILAKQILLNTGRLSRIENNIPKAFEFFREAIISPAYRPREREHNAQVHYEIAVTHRSIGRRAEAVQAARQGLALSNNPKRKDRLQELIKSL